MRKLVIGNVELAEMICDFAGALPGSVYEKKVKHELNVLRPWASQNEPVSMADAARLAVKVIEKAEQTGKDGN